MVLPIFLRDIKLSIQRMKPTNKKTHICDKNLQCIAKSNSEFQIQYIFNEYLNILINIFTQIYPPQSMSSWCYWNNTISTNVSIKAFLNINIRVTWLNREQFIQTLNIYLIIYLKIICIHFFWLEGKMIIVCTPNDWLEHHFGYFYRLIWPNNKTKYFIQFAI